MIVAYIIASRSSTVLEVHVCVYKFQGIKSFCVYESRAISNERIWQFYHHHKFSHWIISVHHTYLCFWMLTHQIFQFYCRLYTSRLIHRNTCFHSPKIQMQPHIQTKQSSTEFHIHIKQDPTRFCLYFRISSSLLFFIRQGP